MQPLRYWQTGQSATRKPNGYFNSPDCATALNGLELANHYCMFKDTAGHEGLTEAIIACGIRIHAAWGPGLLESVYRACLLIELEADGHLVETKRRLQLVYKGHELECEFCPDLIVDSIVVVELKAVEKLAPVHKAQLITYLKLTGLPVGLLMNFNVSLLKYGTQRVVRPDLLIRTN